MNAITVVIAYLHKCSIKVYIQHLFTSPKSLADLFVVEISSIAFYRRFVLYGVVSYIESIF